MTRLERNANIAAVVIPFLGVILAAVLLWNRFLGPRDLAIFAVMYLLTAIGVTVGFHRLLTHRAFETHRWLRYTLAILGSMSLQGGVIDWVASKRFARDLVEDPTMRRINRGFPLIALGSLVLPFLLGFALSGGSLVDGGLSALLWAGLVRIFLVHHITWSINSICHFFGSRRFDTDDQSTNVFWLALPSLGEAWHHNHHAFPQSAFHGLRWYELDPSGWLILGLERVGLAWDVVTVTPERARAKLKGGIAET
jgi:stearoyl-CoA desaturase (delta-9 desaturase)